MPEAALPPEYIEIDSDPRRVRLTHLPSGDAVMRPTHIEGPDARLWTDALSAFLARHPDAHAIHDGRGRFHGDARDLPAAGGGFAVGDLVVTQHLGGRPMARRVMSAFEDGPRTNREADCAPFAYRLEDGATLRYSQIGVTWESPNAHGTHDVTRRTVPGEDAEAIRIPVETAILTCMSASRTELLSGELIESILDEADAPARRRLSAGLKDTIGRLGDAEFDLEDNPSEHTAGEGMAVLQTARDLLGEVAERHRSAYPSRDRDHRRLDARLSRMDAVLDALRLRGVEPGTPSPSP